ncbi:MAG: hypothetical protein ACREQ8_07905, partial [Woeseiaceae bacterium]
MNRFSRFLPIVIASAGLLAASLSNVAQADDPDNNNGHGAGQSLSCHDLHALENSLRKFLRVEADEPDADDGRLPEVSRSCRDLGNFVDGLREIRDG